MAKKTELGATGEFPEGQLNEHDEGELNIGMGIEGKNLIVDFGKSIEWIGMSKQQALQFADFIIKNANKIED